MYEDKYLWDMIDRLRDELSIAQDGVTDLNEVVKDLQAEAIEQIKDNKRLRKENAVAVADERVIEELQADKMKHILAYDTLQTEYNSLKAELDKVNKGNIDGIVDIGLENERLQAENRDLKNALETYECGCKYPKELKNDAEEYFHHNPQDEKIWYMLITKDDLDEDGVLDAHKDIGVDAVAEFDNYKGKIDGAVFK